MSVEILVNVTPRESRAAVLHHGVVQELHVERASRRGFAGNVYVGRVTRVLPGMQAAFVDIGLERAAFLHASDIAPDADIGALVNEGDLLLVQVQKDPIGSKGARLTMDLGLPSRFLVHLPRGSGIGVSARIEDEAERERLRAIMGPESDSAGGWILRTAAEGVDAAALAADRSYLERLWARIREQATGAPAGLLLHEDLALPLRVLRDLSGESVARILVDDAATADAMAQFVDIFVPELAGRIERFAGRRPLFDQHGVEEEIERALERKVPLKSGGYLVFDQTEAMTTIDVNTGAYVGQRDLEDTAWRTNLEAAAAIARQLRLRNLGGIVIADFIDMAEPAHREGVLSALGQALALDRVRTQISGVSALGLVEMTRKRTRESLERQLCRPCPSCDSRGFVRTAETVAYQIFREVLRRAGQFDFRELVLMAHQDVIELLLDAESAVVADLVRATGKPIRLQAEARFAEDQFDVVLV